MLPKKMAAMGKGQAIWTNAFHIREENFVKLDPKEISIAAFFEKVKSVTL